MCLRRPASQPGPLDWGSGLRPARDAQVVLTRTGFVVEDLVLAGRGHNVEFGDGRKGHLALPQDSFRRRFKPRPAAFIVGMIKIFQGAILTEASARVPTVRGPDKAVSDLSKLERRRSFHRLGDPVDIAATEIPVKVHAVAVPVIVEVAALDRAGGKVRIE